MSSEVQVRGPVQLRTARWTIFLIWVSALFLYVVLFLAAPYLRDPLLIRAEIANTALLKVLSLVMPVVGTFMGFWFGEEQRVRAGTIGRDKLRIAIVTTLAYHVILTVSILIAIFSHYGEHYPSFEQRVNFTFQLGVYASILATAPPAFLTGTPTAEAGKGIAQPEKRP